MATLVTGSAGFVGLNLLEALLARGDEVIAFDALPLPEAAAADFGRLPGTLHLERGDVRDRTALDALMGRHRVDRILHAAAITAGPERDAAEPARIAEVNFLATIGMLELARKHAVKRMVYAGTGAVYGDKGIVAHGSLDEERDLPRPVGMYPITKYAAERTCLRLRTLWGLDVVVGRLAMVFGRWEYESGARDRMSMTLQTARLAFEGEAAAILRVAELRDWIYGPDVAAGLVALLDASSLPSPVYHVGTGRPWAIDAWCENLVAAFPGFGYRFVDDPKQANVAPLSTTGRSPFSVQRIQSEAGFRPQYPLDRAFDDYLAWLREHPQFLQRP